MKTEAEMNLEVLLIANQIYSQMLGGLLIGAAMNPDPKASAECLRQYVETQKKQAETYQRLGLMNRAVPSGGAQ